VSRAGKLILLTVLAIAGFGLSLAAGKVWVPLEAWTAADPRWTIIAELRVPRALLGVLIGAGLGLSGAVLQGLLRNPLADPGVLGVSSSGAMGAVASIIWGASLGPWGPFGGAMLAAGGAMALLTALTWRSQDVVGFVLAGTVLASLTGALTAFFITLAPNPYAVAAAIDWLMGALTDRSWDDLARAAPFIIAGMGCLFVTGPALDALTLGEDGARSLGVSVRRTLAMAVLGAGLAVGASVAVTGVVGFVGLVVPHALRPWIGARPGALLLPSALGGTILVLVADSLCRLAPGAGEVRLGVAMALLGAPFFLWLLAKREARGWR
jgi:iron complex transport system permease protein